MLNSAVVQSIFLLSAVPNLHSDITKASQGFTIAIGWYLYQFRLIWLNTLEVRGKMVDDVLESSLWKKLGNISADLDDLIYNVYIACAKILQAYEEMKLVEKDKLMNNKKSGTILSSLSSSSYSSLNPDFLKSVNISVSNTDDEGATMKHYRTKTFIPVDELQKGESIMRWNQY